MVILESTVELQTTSVFGRQLGRLYERGGGRRELSHEGVWGLVFSFIHAQFAYQVTHSTFAPCFTPI